MSSHGDAPRDGDRSVAIIGMAGLFPGAPDVETFWENIVAGVDAIGDPPDWGEDFPCDPGSSANDRVYTKRGGYLGDLVTFDPLAYGVMPRAVDGGEPEHFVALRLAHEALADAGYLDRDFHRERTAVILGRGTYVNRGMIAALQHGLVVDQTVRLLGELHPEYAAAELDRIKRVLKASLPPFDSETAQSLSHSAMCGRIANRLDLKGPAYAVDAACASSLIAVELAMKELYHGSCDLALAGGIQISTTFPILLLFCQLGALSRNGQVRPFHPEADGTLLGEGAGVLALKRLADAERDGDRIYAVVKSVGVASDGRAVGVLAPRVEGQELALRRAYERAGVAPETVGLMEAHGTGTPLGDATEIEAIHRVFGARRGTFPSCALGAVKSMIGHSIPAAGAAGLIKVALALYRKVLPPTLHADVDDPRLAAGPFYLNSEARPWIHGGALPRRAAVSAFGFGGINAHAVLEEHAGATVSTARRWRPARQDSELFVIEAPSREELGARCQGLQRFLEANADVAPEDLAYTLAGARDGESEWCLAVVAASRDEFDRKLAHAVERLQRPSAERIKDRSGIFCFPDPLGREAKIAFLFPGEGAQYEGMLRDLCIHFDDVRAAFDRMDGALIDHERGALPSQFVFPPPGHGAGGGQRAARLLEMDAAVEAVFTANQGLYALVRRFEIRPDAVVGHSSGEYSAVLAAGAVNLSVEQRLVEHVREMNRVTEVAARRGLVAEGVLLAVGLSKPEALDAVLRESDGALHLAIDNCPHQVVLCGSQAAASRAQERLQAEGAVCQRLPFNRGYHTPLFAAFSDELRHFFESVEFVTPRIPLYSCMTAAAVSDRPEEIRRLIREQWAHPVRFRETIEAMYAAGVRIFVEIGPRGNLSAFVADTLGKRPHLAVPANVTTRSGITQLHHLLGLLVAHRVPLNLAPLFEGRGLRQLPVESLWTGAHVATPTRRAARLLTALPLLRAAAAKDQAATGEEVARRPSSSKPAAFDSRAHLESVPGDLAAEVAVALQGDANRGQASWRPEAADVMSAYLRNMEEFLSTQEEVMQAFLEGAADGHDRAPVESFGPGTVSSAAGPTPTDGVAHTAASVGPPSVDTGVRRGRARVGEPGDIAELLRDLISDKTGYPPDMIDPTLDLEADLGIDSIKRVEILGAFDAETGLIGAEMDGIAPLRTLGQMIQFLTARAPLPGGPPQEAAVPRRQPWLLLGDVACGNDRDEMAVRCTLSLDEERFLQDHLLGGRVSPDAAVKALPVFPLAMSLELMAEAAALAAPGRRPIGFRDVHAHRWLAFVTDRVEVEVVARPCARDAVDVSVRSVLEGGNVEPSPLVAGTVVMGPAFPAPAVPSPAPLRAERAPRWQPAELYDERMSHGMFHGPAFRGVASMDAVGENGADATLRSLPADTLLRSRPHPEFAIDPLLIDAAGQVLGYWNADQLEPAVVVFPVGIREIAIYGPRLDAPETARCTVRVVFCDASRIIADIEIVAADGNLLARLGGWEVKRFPLPQRFYAFRLAPRDAMLSVPMPGVLPAEGVAGCRFVLPDIFSGPDGVLWREVHAHLVLSRREREVWRSMKATEKRRTEWLIGRVAAKDAVRLLLRTRYGLAVYPSEVEIAPDAQGRPGASGTWRERMRGVPLVSLAHSGNVAVALACEGQPGDGIGIDLERLGERTENIERVAFTPGERRHLDAVAPSARDEWVLRLWCAKEAVAKALGSGLVSGPLNAAIRTLDPNTGTVGLLLSGELASRFPGLRSTELTAHTLRDGEEILAVATQGGDREEAPAA